MHDEGDGSNILCEVTNVRILSCCVRQSFTWIDRNVLDYGLQFVSIDHSTVIVCVSKSRCVCLRCRKITRFFLSTMSVTSLCLCSCLTWSWLEYLSVNLWRCDVPHLIKVRCSYSLHILVIEQPNLQANFPHGCWASCASKPPVEMLEARISKLETNMTRSVWELGDVNYWGE